jgi:hypothetical protein
MPNGYGGRRGGPLTIHCGHSLASAAMPAHAPQRTPGSRGLGGWVDAGDAEGGEAVVADEPQEKLIKIGAKVVSDGRYVTFQMAEVAVSRQMFAEILSLIARLRAPPALA